METAQEAPKEATTLSPELTQFKQHIDLYEQIMERAVERAKDNIMPQIRSLQREVLVAQRETQYNRVPIIGPASYLPGPCEPQYSTSSSGGFLDTMFTLGMGMILGALYFYIFTKDNKKKKPLENNQAAG